MNPIFSLTIKSEGELDQVVDLMKPYIQSGNIIFLDGDLGAGKTTTINQICKRFGSKDEISSPTFAMRNIYSINKNGHFIEVNHFDLYRIEDEDDIESIGMWELFANRSRLFFIEWYQMIPIEDWPLDWDQYLLQINRDSKTQERTFHFFKVSK